jgi:hypothetical protein
MQKFHTEYKDYSFQEIYDIIKTFYLIEEPNQYTIEPFRPLQALLKGVD